MLVDYYRPGPSAKTVLVVCYSLTGYTLRAAQALAKELGADIAVIREVRPRDGILGYVRSVFEVLAGRLPAIHDLTKNPADYRLVVIGSPVWVSNPASPVQTFATRYQDGIKEMALFCTMGGEGAERTFRMLKTMFGKEPIATLALADRDIDGEGFMETIRRFSKDLRAKLAHTR